MAKLLLVVLVCVLSVLAQQHGGFNQQRNWNYTQELDLKEEKWTENLTHIFIKKPAPIGFFDAWSHINPNPCEYELNCNDCVSKPGGACRYYISRSREVSFCGQRGEYLGCDGFRNLETLTSEAQCVESGFPSIEYVNMEPFVNTRTRCEHIRACRECTTQACAFYTSDLGFEFCGRVEDWGSYPFRTSRITESGECKTEQNEEGNFPKEDEATATEAVEPVEVGADEATTTTEPETVMEFETIVAENATETVSIANEGNRHTNTATTVSLVLVFHAALGLGLFLVWWNFPELFQLGNDGNNLEEVEMVDVPLDSAPSEETLTTINGPDDIIAMVDMMP